ncbi:iron-containing redox enzyme family protein [Bacillus cereus]|nr:iron-containing redox enzyme family protein [Bacillus cereus]
MSEFYFKKPKFREVAKVEQNDNGILVKCHGDEFELSGEASLISSFINSLDGSNNIEEIIKKNESSQFSRDEILDHLEILDEFFLLEEGNVEASNTYSGLKFITKIEDLYYKWQSENGETELSKIMLDGKASLNLITGWTLEYYYVTNRAHDCISPSINRAHGEFQDMLIDFFHEEYRHDKMIQKSLSTLGYKQEDLDNLLPLPYTAAVTNLLNKWAHTDLLSFYAALFIFEGTADEGNGYIEALSKYDLPKGFAKPQAAHNTINVEGDHGNVSRDFYSKIEHVSLADRQRVVKNMRILHETQLKQFEEIIKTYDVQGEIKLRNYNESNFVTN